MNKYLVVMLTVLLSAGAAVAQQQEKKQEVGIAQWLRGLQQKLSQMKPKRDVPMSTGVAGVRGAKEGSQTKLYWKGKNGEDAVTETELKEFREIIGYLEKDDKGAALHECEEFMKEYPDSALIPDVKKTMDLVKAETKEPEK